MKNIGRKLSIILVLTLLTTFLFGPITISAAKDIEIEAESAILVDAETGKILYAKNPDMALPPASMSKMMTEYLVWEAVEEGEISWDQEVEISDYAYEISGNEDFSGVGLYQDKTYTIKELYDAMAINSDNATSIALAEAISGSEGEFIKRMNEKGEEMGLQEYKFVNATGIDNHSLDGNHPEGTEEDDTNLLSARSSALLAYHLINDYPEALDVSSQTELEFDEKTVTNWNYMLDHEATYLQQFHYEGVDGLKTGHTDLAGYCFTGTAEKDGKRLISVVMKTDSEIERFEQTKKLLDYGFSKFEEAELFPAGYQLEGSEELPVVKGKEKEVEIALADTFTEVIRSGEEESYEIEYSIDESLLDEDGALEAPIEKGMKVGTAKLVSEDDKGYIFDENSEATVDIVAVDQVDKSNWFVIMLSAVWAFFTGLFGTVVDFIKGWF